MEIMSAAPLAHVLKRVFTGKSIDFERYITAPEIWWVLTVGVDPRGYFLGGFNLFKLAKKKLLGFFHLYDIDYLLLCGKDLYVSSAGDMLHRDCVISLYL